MHPPDAGGGRERERYSIAWNGPAFERFAHPENERNPPGTGPGPSLVRAVVRLRGAPPPAPGFVRLS